MNIITFSVMTALLLVLLIFIYKKMNIIITNLAEVYNANSQFYKLNVNRIDYQNNYKVETRGKLGYTQFDKNRTSKGTYIYKDSIFFYEKKHKKYFAIESYKESWYQISKKRYKSPEIFSIDLSGQVIMAWINQEDMNNELLGNKISPIRIFRLEYDSKKYLVDVYLKNVKIYMQTNGRLDQRFVRLFGLFILLGIALLFFWIKLSIIIIQVFF